MAKASFLDILQHAVSAGVPYCQVHEQVVVDSYLLEPELEAICWRDVFRKVFFLAWRIGTSMQFNRDDFPTSLTPTSAKFTFSSFKCEKETSLSVSIEYDDPRNIDIN